MNDTLSQALAQLNLQPGQCKLFQVNGYHLEIRRPVEETPDYSDMVMLEPWVDFPSPTPSIKVPVRPGKLPLPDPPEIPPDWEDNER